MKVSKLSNIVIKGNIITLNIMISLIIKHSMYVGVPKIFQNEMCVRRMYRVRNSTDNNKFKMKFTYSDENENTHFPQLKRSVFFVHKKVWIFLEYI